VVSRQESDVYWPILDYEGMTPENGFKLVYRWAKIPVIQLMPAEWNSLRWTKKIPLEVKNFHRQLWGLKPTKPKAPRLTKRRTRRTRRRMLHTGRLTRTGAPL
jgi:hypothetical protein